MRTADGQRRQARMQPLLRLAAGALLLTGLVLVGQGAWIKAKAAVAQILLDRAFEQSIEPPARPGTEAQLPPFDQVSLTLDDPPAASAKPVKPWPWADIAPLARISAEHLDRSDIVLDSTSGEALAFGPGHMPSTPLPGEAGISVLAGHRDTHFAWIRHLKPGDRIKVEMRDGRLMHFTMRRAWIARFDASGIDPHATGNRLALTTCWPFGAANPGPERYIVEFDLDPAPVETAAN